MSYTIQPSENGEYIILKVKGTIDRQSAMEQNLEAHAMGKEMDIHNYLVDVTEAKNTDPIKDQYDFAYKDMREAKGIDKRARVATVVSKGDHSHDFIETVSRNSGFSVKLFNNIEAAKSYLQNRSS